MATTRVTNRFGLIQCSVNGVNLEQHCLPALLDKDATVARQAERKSESKTTQTVQHSFVSFMCGTVLRLHLLD